MKYDADAEVISMNATLPDSSYAGWGWGSSMVNTEMVIFVANGDSSSATTYYSSDKSEPELQSSMQSCYTTSVTKKDDGNVEIMTTRPLDCGIANSYAVTLDTDLSLISAWDGSNAKMVYHGKNYLEFTQMFSSDGTCVS